MQLLIAQWEEGVLYKLLYEQALSPSPAPYPFVYHLDRKGAPFTYLRKNTLSLFIYNPRNEVIEQ